MSALESERLARAALSRAFEPGDLRVSSLVVEHGAVPVHEALTAEGDGELRLEAAQRLAGSDPVRDLERAERIGIRFVVPGDAEWPTQLDDLRGVTDPSGRMGGVPIGLWVRGPRSLRDLPRSVAVVGSRSATTYGTEAAADISSALVQAGWAVVSGAAFGIDVAAHRGALAGGGVTVAVLACGVDRAYPMAHSDLIEHLAVETAVVAEVPPGCAVSRPRFLSRNRVIAALAGGTVVVEAAVRSGALSTANWATRLGRHLAAVPGPVTSAPSVGVHHLIRSGAATLVTCAEEILELVGDVGEYLLADPRAPHRPRDRLDHRQQRVLEAVPVAVPAGTDSISRAAGLGLVEVRGVLTALEARGLVRSEAGGWRVADGAA